MKPERKMLLFFLSLLIISIAGYFGFGNYWVEFIFAHLGGLSIVSLFGCGAGAIAKKKGYSYRNAFLLTFLLSIILGVIAVLLVKPISCGGSVSLAAALFIFIIYFLIKPVKVNLQNES